METKLLSEERVASILEISMDEVRKLFESGELPGKQLGSRWFTTERILIQTVEPDKVETPTRLVQSSAPKNFMKLDPKTNYWGCTACHHGNPPEVVECRQCGEVRRAPLICYLPKRNSA